MLPPFSFTEILIVTTPPHPPTLSEQELANIIKAEIIGQDTVVNAVARELVRRITSRPADRPVGIFLPAGPNQDHAHHTISRCLAEVLRATAAAYNMNLGWRQDLFLFRSAPVASKVMTFIGRVKAHPRLLLVITVIERAYPQVLAQLEEAWHRGTIRNHMGKHISIAGTTIVLTTDLASEQIGQLARSESDPDRLHIECLKLLLGAGFPATVVTSIDRAFCLRSNTAGELARDQHRRFQECVAEHGLQLEAGGIDARVLIDAMDPPIGPYAAKDGIDLRDLDQRLSEAKAQGAAVVRLVLGENGILVVPPAKPAATKLPTSPAAAEEGSSPETSGARP
jgi:hypothetical protein